MEKLEYKTSSVLSGLKFGIQINAQLKRPHSQNPGPSIDGIDPKGSKFIRHVEAYDFIFELLHFEQLSPQNGPNG